MTLDKLLEMLVNFAFLAGGALPDLAPPTVGRAPLKASCWSRVLMLLLLPLGILAALSLGKHPLSRPIYGRESMAVEQRSRLPNRSGFR